MSKPTRLETLCFTRRLSITGVLNELQDNGVISDLCVTAADVAPEDEEHALFWLRRRYSVKRTE